TTWSARASQGSNLERTRWLRSTSLTGRAPRCMSEIRTVSTPTILAASRGWLLSHAGEHALLPPQPLHRRLSHLLEGHGARLEPAGGTAARPAPVERREARGRGERGDRQPGSHRSLRLIRSVFGRRRRELRRSPRARARWGAPGRVGERPDPPARTSAG